MIPSIIFEFIQPADSEKFGYVSHVQIRMKLAQNKAFKTKVKFINEAKLH
jgi:hypothetical protein